MCGATPWAQIFFKNFKLQEQSQRPIQEWDVREVIWQMVRSGRYVPHAHWCIPQQGRGMWWGKAQALWRLCTAPSEATFDDVDIVVFELPAGHVNGPCEIPFLNPHYRRQ